MTPAQTMELFAQLSNTRLREWLDTELSRQLAILTLNADPLMLHRAQGAVQVLTALGNNIDTATQRRAGL